MPSLTLDGLTTALLEARDRPNPTLFAGSGVGRRVSLPDWGEYMEHLARGCERFGEPLAADLIRLRASQRQFLAAASVFKTCAGIPRGELLKHLAAPFDRPFEHDLLKRLKPLIDLRFSAIITTNFDHALHEAAAQSEIWARPVENGDSSLRGASLIPEFFIARIHGRAEDPQSMVVDSADYQSLELRNDYLDFLLDVLRNRSCLFLGFSFSDPALNHVLRVYEERFGPVFAALHSAVVPAGDAELENRLKWLNIQTVTYDATDDHKILWRALHEASRVASSRTQSPGRAVAPQGGLHRFMAFSYSQVASARDSLPIASLVQDGIILAGVTSRDHTDEQGLVAHLQRTLRISAEQSTELVRASLARLLTKQELKRTDMGLERPGHPPDVLEKDLEILSSDVVDRMRVRAGASDLSTARALARSALEKVFMARAWDLAAHYAGSAAGWGADLRSSVSQLISEAAGHRKFAFLPALGSAIVDLLQSPEDRQAPVLGRLARAAFGVQLVLATPRQALFQRHALPEKVYLDANVLMPALTDGHPLRPAYVEALSRLRTAATVNGAKLEIAVGQQFLNEIVSHRYIAGEMVRELDLEDPEKLHQHILFYGATNTNVFVAAYASAVGRLNHKVRFADFLREVAPYSTEPALQDHLSRSGVLAVRMEFFGTSDPCYRDVLTPLLDGYSRELQPSGKEKHGILVQHEAAQMARLRADVAEGNRVLFVTADSRLRRILQNDSRLHDLAGISVSHIGLVALVDVMVGLEPDSRSAARLIWAQSSSNAEKALFEYFVALGVRRYTEGMAIEMEDAARRVAAAAAQDARAKNLDLHGKVEGALSENARFLDTYENEFFRKWSEAIQKREAEEKR